MKQGLNWAAYGLAVLPLDKIFTSETSLNTAAKKSPTAGFGWQCSQRNGNPARLSTTKCLLRALLSKIQMGQLFGPLTNILPLDPRRRYPQSRTRCTHKFSRRPPHRHKNGRRLLDQSRHRLWPDRRGLRPGPRPLHDGGNTVAAEWPTLHPWTRNLQDPWICGYPAGIQRRSAQRSEVG